MKNAIVLVIALITAVGFCAAGATIGSSGQDGTAENPWLIKNFDDFQVFCSNPAYWDDHTRLENDLDLTSAGTYPKAPISSDPDSDSAFNGTEFSGTFDGNGHKIRNLTVNGIYYCALFGKTASDANIKNLGIENASVFGSRCYVSALVGVNNGNITNCYAIGTVTGDVDTGILVGWNISGIVTRCHSSGTVSGYDRIGGLVGLNEAPVTICHSTAEVNGDNHIGGLVGQNKSDIIRCYSNGTVTGDQNNSGGLVGYNEGSLESCYSLGSVTADDYTGGLVGYNNAQITFCYSKTAVGGDYYVGGLVGYNYGGTIDACYSTGPVTGRSYVNAFTGKNNTTSTNSFWDVQTSQIGEPEDTNFGAIGKTTAQMQDINTYLGANWDFDPDDGDREDWIMPDGDYPKLYFQKACMYILKGDLNQDCKTNLADLAIMAANWMIDCIAQPENPACAPF